MSLPLVDNQYPIEKMPGKGGWSYVAISEIPASERRPMGLVRVRGFIDSYELKQFNLLPMKDGKMLLPLKAAVRKQIRKQAGDFVHVVLFADDSPVVVPDEFMLCLLESPKAHQFFETLSDSNKKYYIDWIEEAKRIETKAERINKTINLLENRRKFYDWPMREE
ncbi:MAG: DUF1905 domain-containing protein [Saprospiraceae bacterium]|nr:DUF1905 domain-containing protein [Saprospiraceae bacterium]